METAIAASKAFMAKKENCSSCMGEGTMVWDGRNGRCTRCTPKPEPRNRDSKFYYYKRTPGF